MREEQRVGTEQSEKGNRERGMCDAGQQNLEPRQRGTGIHANGKVVQCWVSGLKQRKVTTPEGDSLARGIKAQWAGMSEPSRV